jgi:hypothetical protein
VLKAAKGANQEKKPEEPKGNIPKAHKEVNYIYCGPDSYESRRKQKLTAREVMEVSPATPEYPNPEKVLRIPKLSRPRASMVYRS